MSPRQRDILHHLYTMPLSQRELMTACCQSGSQILHACLTLQMQGLIRLDRPSEAEKATAGETGERIYRYHITADGRAAVEGRRAG